MSDDLVAVNAALKTENDALRGVIEQLSSEKEALVPTIGEVVNHNIALKAGAIRLERQIAKLNQEYVLQVEKLAETEAKLVQLSTDKPEPEKKKSK